MPVILDPGTEEMKGWLDPSRTTWSKDLQAILKPYEGELECYPVTKEVGKVGNNSPDFIIPINSRRNKSNIANFFASAKQRDEEISADAADSSSRKELAQHKLDVKAEADADIAVQGDKRGHVSEVSAVNEGSKKRKVQQTPIALLQQKPKIRSATHNSPTRKMPSAKSTDMSQRLTSFFKRKPCQETLKSDNQDLATPQFHPEKGLPRDEGNAL